MAYKVFSNGDALTGAELNTYLMNQSVIQFASTTARDAAIPSPAEGQLVWLQDVNKYVYYTGSAWADLIPTAQTTGNAIINGAFDIWQRGTSFTHSTGTAIFSADRFQYNSDGTGGSITLSQQTFTPGTAPVSGYEGQFFWRYTCTTARTSQTYNLMFTKTEDVRTLAGQTATLSFWAKADSARTMNVTGEQNFGSGGSTAVAITWGTSNLTTSWQRFTYTVSLASIAGKTLGAGNNLTTIFGMVNVTGATIDIWGVQLEAGSVATPFKRNAPSIQAELAACQRYYWRTTPGVQYADIGPMGMSGASTLFGIRFTNPVPMRVGATSLEFSNLYVAQRLTNSTDQTVTGAANNNSDPVGTSVFFTVASGLTTNNVGSVKTSQTNSYIAFSAEL